MQGAKARSPFSSRCLHVRALGALQVWHYGCEEGAAIRELSFRLHGGMSMEPGRVGLATTTDFIVWQPSRLVVATRDPA